MERASSRADAAASAAAGEVAALREQVERASSRADAAASAAAEAAGAIRARAAGEDDNAGDAGSLIGLLKSIESKVDSLAERAGASAPAVESARTVVESGLAGLRDDLASRAESVERRVDSLADAVFRTEAAASELRARADAAPGGPGGPGGEAERASDAPSGEAAALLRLSGYLSSMRMRAESKYGGTAELGEMSERTAGIAGILGGIPAGPGGGGTAVPAPAEVRQWAVSKMLECADRWDVRFSDALGILVSGLGRDELKEAVRVRQVRDIYGARAAAELRAELGMDEKE